MQESREEYKIKITKELTEKMNLKKNRIYSMAETDEFIKTHDLKKGIVQFTPLRAYTGKEIVNILVSMDLRVTDEIHKAYGIYENKIKCDCCGKYYIDTDNIEDEDIDFFNEKMMFLCDRCKKNM